MINSIKTVITDPEKSLNVPNAITASRAVIAIVAAFLFASENQASFYWGIALFTCAGLTDLVDGWLARKTGQVSDLGKMLDPVADKIAIFALFAAFSVKLGLPLWVPAIYAIKELTQLIVGALLFSKVGRPLQANVWGKSASLVLYGGALLYLLGHLFWESLQVVGLIVLVIGLALSVFAGLGYYRQIKKMPALADPGTKGD
ncbi:MAG: CDP-alcohol phosphatidyltransferase family protein [Bacillota bacterium]